MTTALLLSLTLDLPSTHHSMLLLGSRNWSVCCTSQNKYHERQGFEMASLSKESGTVRETAANPGFTKGVNIEGTSSLHGMVWHNDIVLNPQLPSPENYGWKQEKGES